MIRFSIFTILRAGATCVALLCLTLAPALGQTPDAFVLPGGMLRLEVVGSVASYDARFGGSGRTAPLAAPLLPALTPAAFAPLRPLAEELDRFFGATEGGPVEIAPDALSLGTLDVRAAANAVRVPLRLSVGLLPRLEIGGGAVLERGELLRQRFILAGGTVGLNPAPEENAALLARLGAEWTDLGSASLLPLSGSPLGEELQRRVRTATGGELQLPPAAADTALFQALLIGDFGLPPLASRVEPWRMGDAEVFAHGLLFSTFGQSPLPTDSSGVHFRSSLRLAARLPTGAVSDTVELLTVDREVRRSGFAAQLVGDLFVGRFFWATGAVRFARLRGGERLLRPVSADAPLAEVAAPERFRERPGAELEVRLAPRVRLAEAVSAGLEYHLRSVGETRLERTDGEALPGLGRPGGALQRVGAEIRYTTLPAYWQGRSSLPAEVSLHYARTLSGPAGTPASGMVVIRASLLPRLWGRSPARRGDSTANPGTAPSLPDAEARDEG